MLPSWKIGPATNEDFELMSDHMLLGPVKPVGHARYSETEMDCVPLRDNLRQFEKAEEGVRPTLSFFDSLKRGAPEIITPQKTPVKKRCQETSEKGLRQRHLRHRAA
jgi:hypothetical protein